ncbi:MAG: nucleotidyltransferase domain-containing protein, partial [Candidatus Omnitrophica bacterium]|nr:nucleotidyltransferase domain-containing protein [Candidatus Omnitrophota bacterium]
MASLCEKSGIVSLDIFGSFAREEQAKDSDIDLLVRFSKPKSLLEIVRIERIFSELLGRKVDLLTEASISPYLRDRIRKEAKVFYEKKDDRVYLMHILDASLRIEEYIAGIDKASFNEKKLVQDGVIRQIEIKR